jgi:CO dehydrogenase/acetyl-CoA synthase delta subunit
MLRMAEFRVQGLKIRKEALVQYEETKRLRDQLAAQSKPLEAEGTEIKERIDEAKITQFAATGTLRQSALPYGGRMLYRLTDPASGRTVVYVNTDDANVIKLEGMFIGIRGDVVEDPVRRIKFIKPTDATQIEPSGLIKGSITSTLTPASLLPTSAASVKPE